MNLSMYVDKSTVTTKEEIKTDNSLVSPMPTATDSHPANLPSDIYSVAKKTFFPLCWDPPNTKRPYLYSDLKNKSIFHNQV